MRFASSVAQRVVREGSPIAEALAAVPELPARLAKFAAVVAKDLISARERSVVLAGLRQPKEIHALAMVLNRELGNVGKTVFYADDPILEAGEPSHDLVRLRNALRAGEVDRLIILGGNPVYTAPADLELDRLIGNARHSAYLGMYDNETARCCGWLLAEAHYLESWSDARAADGTVSIVQPLIQPLFGGRTRGQVLAALAGVADPSARELVERRYGRTPRTTTPSSLERQFEERSGFESESEPAVSSVAPPDVPATWLESVAVDARLDRLLCNGVIPGTALPYLDAPLETGELASWLGEAHARFDGIELALALDPRVHDGRFTNNPWLLELPDAITRLTWGNAALFAPMTAERLGLHEGDRIRIAVDGRHLEAPVFTQPGLAEQTVSLSLGYGRSGHEHHAAGVGVDAYALRLSGRPWFISGTEIDRLDEPAGDLMPVSVQAHAQLEGRPIVLSRTIEEYRTHPEFAEEYDKPPATMHEQRPAPGHQWGMTIDLDACVGCNACVVACQAENNVPTVGRIDVAKGREMHWLRLDRYYLGELERARVVHQPMLCQHCEHAPCEYVCPTYATAHSPDGINEMVYNRCVGTRFCSNNCPYKVRRFNWFNFNRSPDEVTALHYNPDVTVRERGVMEKCTYCVQRIRRTEIAAKNDGRDVGPNEVQTACQQVCPAHAIVFGDIADSTSNVSEGYRDPRTYAVLHDTGTQPRTRYQAVITNPHPDLEEGSS